MYTQCPNCATALRVTAEVLKQAAGKVRCGGCHRPFNALLYLSETKPAAPPRKDEDESLPELKPEPDEATATPPAPMSAAQSAALLKTLDQLAGEEIRLEDTGVEWRLLDEDEDDGDVDDNYADDPDAGFAGNTDFDEDDSNDLELNYEVVEAGDDNLETDDERAPPDALHAPRSGDDTGIHYAAINEAEDQPVNDDISVNDIFADTGVPVDTIIFGSKASEQIDELLQQGSDDAHIDERLDDDAGAAMVDERLDDDTGAAKVDELLDNDAGTARVDELLEHAPTPVDELLSESPNSVDAGEVFDDASRVTLADNEGFGVFDEQGHDDVQLGALDQALADNDIAEVETPTHTPSIEDELRFDDNTGLPDNFDFDSLPERQAAAPAPAATSSAASSSANAEFEKEVTRVDLALDDDDEWDDLLSEVDQAFGSSEPQPVKTATGTGEDSEPGFDDEHGVTDESGAVAEPPSAPSRPLTLEEELAALPDEDDEDYSAGVVPVVAESAAPLDIDTQFGLQAKAMGIDLSGLYASHVDDGKDAAKSADTAAPEQPTADENEIPATADAVANEAAKGESTAMADNTAAAAADEELSVKEQADDEPASDGDKPGAVELALEQDDATDDRDDVEASDEKTAAHDNGSDEELAANAGEDTAADDDRSDETVAAKTGEDTSAADAQSDDKVLDIDQPLQAFPANTSELEFELSQAQKVLGDDDVEFNPEHYVPPQTEEEQTVNMMIDQDLMRLAITDEDGMASTMVLEGKPAPRSRNGGGDTAADDDVDLEFDLIPADAESFESIVMEGDYVRTEAEQARLAAEAKARGERGETLSPDIAQQAMRNEAAKKGLGNRRFGYGIIAGIVVLVLLLAGQFVHQSRAELATVPAVAGTIEPVYRAVGAPITPNWDVTGWRFEVTKGSTTTGGQSGSLPASAAGDGFVDTAGGEVLTIESRLGNKSGNALPYPLISVSLTDRFEETIGNKVLEPVEYLPDGVNAASMVGPGETFNAVIAVDSPSADATGFKLNVCYRLDNEQLRCAIEDFR